MEGLILMSEVLFITDVVLRQIPVLRKSLGQLFKEMVITEVIDQLFIESLYM